MSTVLKQASIIIKKNALLNRRSYEYLRDIFPPLISAIFNIVAKNASALQFIAALYLPLSLSGFLRSFVFNFINEKSEKYKETQKIMGLKDISYNLGWLTFNFGKAFLIGVIYLVPCLAAQSFSDSSLTVGEIILAYALFICAALSQCYMYTTFFSHPKLPSDLITLIHLIASALQYVAAVDTVQESQNLLNLLSLFPQTCIIFIFLSAGWNSSQSSHSFSYSKMAKNYSYSNGIMMLVIDTIVYFILYLYFDQVVKNEYGTQRDALFFINWIWKKNPKNSSQIFSQNQKKNDEEMNASQNEIDFCSAKYKEEFLNVQNLSVSVKVRDLVKKFGDFTAVDHLSLTLYEKQIFCLLGHNGAGKTTTISLLTGLLQKNQGKIIMNGLDFDQNKDQIRQNIGLCQQKDVLYDNFTIEEHLQFIGRIKGKDGVELENEIKYLIKKCQLSNEVGKTAKILSGGNKRKLSLAMALIGGSKIVFLDEPSSGLDFNARKEIKQILLELKKEQRTIILTTHHLEEAEECSDRIAIMAKGKLLTLGTNEFIKRNFGVGYHLTIAKKSENQINSSQKSQIDLKQNEAPEISKKEYQLSSEKCNQIRQIINQIIPEAKYNPQSQVGIVKFTLPFSSKQHFSNLFSTLEKDNELNLDLEANTLEDAFINIGMDENKYLNPSENQTQLVQEKFTDFSNIALPECLKKAPIFDFLNQTFGCFQRKVFITMRSISIVISFFLPLLLQLVGVFVANYAITESTVNNDNTNPDQQISVQFLQIIIFGIFGMIAYNFVTTSFCGVPVMERELKLRYSLNVMGCRSLPYWLGTFIFDFIFISINLYIFFIICFIIGFNAVTDHFGEFFGLTQLFIFAIICQSYFLSFFFEKSQTAYKLVFFVNYFLFYTIPALIASQSKTAQGFMVLISPYLCYNVGTQLISSDTLPFSKEYNDANYPSWQNQIWQYVIILLGQGIVYAWIALRIEQRTEKFKADPKIDYSEFENQPTPAEVAAEDHRVSNMNCQDKIKVSHLYKTYRIDKKTPPYTAIKNNSFGVQNGEILGLLGPNGAGKSTTFNILTSLIPKSQGSVKLKNIEVESGLMEVYQDVGICPQFDNLYENLTVFEHLRLFGRIKGLKGNDLKESIDYFLKVMQLEDYINRKASQLSGGNKRKLCVSMALIGGPDMQFFDEPSSGVDPIARRFLWNTLSQSLKLRNGAIVLTTHSMDEAECLCSKIGILINGKFICYGTPQFLKEKYGEGYKITFTAQKTEVAKQEVLKQFQQAKLLNDQSDNQQIALILPYQNFSLSNTFDFFENNLCLKQGLISDFQISQSSLASIFVYFSQFQQNKSQ
ncbi:transporter family ABC domain protein (macronuclear) [Tetrahymena thermophila SB210]|uniref:Transporter family ABC domain protein n=1 Tax=Tetrahymena thermophila (strain SB210) TaxID=312017 RepID=Q23JR2_TETTS|nr:transporter family ABC domain protein [Tetrahymena thermophila SB210]EAR96798.2 transporter family ABC domain protein [Tetrahymena thermophila SB210]|eukprot:XP_001017043.2 transporter family ABC domain protein [Tetrahymena thermophila SB210]